jgi:hypothetical protein
MKVRLTKRFAEFIDGIDLSRAAAGEVLDLSSREAALLILEGWAAPIDNDSNRGVTVVASRHQAEDKPRRSRASAPRPHHSRRKG